MQFVINENNIYTAYINDDDLCWCCKNQYGCPLIECINRGLVIPTEDIIIKECELYKGL